MTLIGSSVENATLTEDGNVMIVTDNQCASEFVLEFAVDTDMPENAVVVTSQVGYEDPVGEDFDSGLEYSLVGVFGSEVSVARDADSGRDDDITVMTDIDQGKAIVDFGSGDCLILEKDGPGAVDLSVEALPGDNGGAIITADGTQHILLFEAGDLGGELVVIDQGETLKVQFVPYLPELANGQAVNPEHVNGVVNRDFLTGEGDQGIQVTLSDLGAATYNNVIGSYVVAPDGSISDIRILFDDAQGDVGDSVLIEGLGEEDELAFFLIQDGADWLAGLSSTDNFTFVQGNGDPGNAQGDVPLYLAQDGILLPDQVIIHSYDADLNDDGLEHVISGIQPGGSAMTLGFEDLTDGGDFDYEDVGLTIEHYDIV